MTTREGPDRPDREPVVVRHEEELAVGAEQHEIGAVRARKRVETAHVSKPASRQVEHADVERAEPDERDSGEVITLPDGSVSIPIFEEQLVVTKRLVVRERVVIRKTTVTEEHRIEADLRRERLEVDADRGVRVVDARDETDTTR